MVMVAGLVAIVLKAGNYLVAPLGKRCGYQIYYKRNLKNLRKQIDELKTIRSSLQPKLDVAERNGENIIKAVQEWLFEVDKITNEEAESLYKKEELELRQSRCWNKSRYSISKSAKKMTDDVVVVLKQKGETFLIGPIAYPPPPGRPETGESSESGESRTSICNVVLETLKDDNINMIGIYGMDGVAMTRLVKNVERRAKADDLFAEVAVAVVSKEVNIRYIQGDIADMLGLKFTEEREPGRAARLYRRLVDDKKKLIVLVDACETLDLEAIGIPFRGGDDHENKPCKIIVTSTSKSVCEAMNTQRNFNIEPQEEIPKAATFGLFGGEGGDYWDDQTYTTVKSLKIIYNDQGIQSLRIEYDDKGHSSWSPYHGLRNKPEDGEPIEVKLLYPDEFLISVSGYYRAGCSSVVHSLKFISNKRTYGPFGVERGHDFSSPRNVGKIIGFHGRSGDVLNAIGAYYEPISSPTDQYETTELFGGRGGSAWDDVVFTTIRKLIVDFDTVVNYLQIEYDYNGRSVWSEVHGQSGSGNNTHTVELDYPGEFLISVSGHIWKKPESITVIRSLKFETNRKVWGPYGKEEGPSFSFPSSTCKGKIIGFHGRCGKCLDSLGAYIEPFPTPSPPTSIGSFGGPGGASWDDGTYTTVRQLIVRFTKVICSICIEYDKDGRSEWSPRHGTGHGDPTEIKLDYPGEFLISVSGTLHLWCGLLVVSSLTFQSNKKTHGPYGEVSGNTFSISPPITGCKIVGFHGKSGQRLDSIGAHFQPL